MRMYHVQVGQSGVLQTGVKVWSNIGESQTSKSDGGLRLNFRNRRLRQRIT